MAQYIGAKLRGKYIEYRNCTREGRPVWVQPITGIYAAGQEEKYSMMI